MDTRISAQNDKILVWIQFLGLNQIFYNESVMLISAYVVGVLIKFDTKACTLQYGDLQGYV